MTCAPRTLLLAALLFAAPALARREYPPEIRSTLTACATPACTVCHTTSRGGNGTATRPFGVTMQNAGLTGSLDLSQLRAALATVDGQGSDSDGDGVKDIPELVQGSDPSNAGSTTPACAAPPPGGGGPTPGAPPELSPDTAQPPYFGCGGAPAALLFSVLLMFAGRTGSASANSAVTPRS